MGSSPILPTIMKGKVTDYYKEKGFNAVYININKEPRRVATLRKPDGTLLSMSYAKYLYTSHHYCDVDKTDNVDHINGDKMDDRIENLQVISGRYNRQKDHKQKEMLEKSLAKFLKEGWQFDRFDGTLRALLLCAAYELVRTKDVDAAVIVKEYVDLAYAFFSKNEPKMVNALLDSIAKQVRG